MQDILASPALNRFTNSSWVSTGTPQPLWATNSMFNHPLHRNSFFSAIFFVSASATFPSTGHCWEGSVFTCFTPPPGIYLQGHVIMFSLPCFLFSATPWACAAAPAALSLGSSLEHPQTTEGQPQPPACCFASRALRHQHVLGSTPSTFTHLKGSLQY